MIELHRRSTFSSDALRGSVSADQRPNALPRRQIHALSKPVAFCSLCRAEIPGSVRDTNFQAAAEGHIDGVYVRLQAGSVLFAEGREAAFVSILYAGQIKLTTTTRDGKTLLLRIAKPNDLLGLSAALSHTPYEVTAQAIEDSLVRTYKKKAFLDFILNNADGGLYAAESLVNEYRSAFNDVRRLALSVSIASRMANLLLEMMRASGDALHAHPVFDILLTHEDLASMLGSSRESITRTLNHFKRTGILAITGRKVTILQREMLEAMI